MPRFLTRLEADAVVRLNRRAYHVLDEVRSIAFKFPDADVAIVDSFVVVGSEKVPSGFLIQVAAEAADVRESLQRSRAGQGRHSVWSVWPDEGQYRKPTQFGPMTFRQESQTVSGVALCMTPL